MPLPDALLAKIHGQERLCDDDLKVLYHSQDLMGLGYLAEIATHRVSQGNVYYHEHTFVRLLQADHFDLGTFSSQAQELITPTTLELRLVSINPQRITLDQVCAAALLLKTRYPQCVIRALSAFQILQYISASNYASPLDVLKKIKDSGIERIEGRAIKSTQGLHKYLGYLPAQSTAHLSDSELAWLSIHELAHRCGLKSDATLSYSTFEPLERRLEQFKVIRNFQDRTQGFASVIPLNKGLLENQFGTNPTLTIDDLKTIAIARLYLDNITLIRSSWGRLGINTAQLALSFGANDLEGSLSNENNSRISGARPFRSMNRLEVRSLIEKSNLKPVEGLDESHLLETVETHIPARKEPSSAESINALYKVSRCVKLSKPERLLLCRESSLMALGTCALESKGRIMDPQFVGMISPHFRIPIESIRWQEQLQPLVATVPPNAEGSLTISIDLGRVGSQEFRLAHLSWLVSELDRLLAIKYEIVIHGIKGLWNLERRENLGLRDLAGFLKEHRVTIIESSSFEAEDDLTNSELAHTHTLLHQMDLATIGKLELAAPYHGRGEPLWESFLARIDLYNNIQAKTHGLLAIKIEIAEGVSLSPAEYLRGVALCRIFAEDIPYIVTPIKQFPLINDNKNNKSRDHRFAAPKLAPLAAFFGSNDLVDQYGDGKCIRAYFEELTCIGLRPHLRTARFYEQ